MTTTTVNFLPSWSLATDPSNTPVRHAGELGHGIHRGVPPLVYHASFPSVASKSALSILADGRTPAHLRQWQQDPPITSAAFSFGTAFHSAVLEPDVFAASYVVEPVFGDCRKTANKASRDAWLAEHEGIATLSAEDMAAIVGMRESVMSHVFASKMLAGGVSELTLRWKDQETGVECKARADYHRVDVASCVDLKSTGDARPTPFSYAAADYGYDLQHAFYAEGFAACGAPLEHFDFVVVEKKSPYAVALYRLEPEDVEAGRAKIREALKTFAECLSTGVYRAYDTSIRTIGLPKRRVA